MNPKAKGLMYITLRYKTIKVKTAYIIAEMIELKINVGYGTQHKPAKQHLRIVYKCLPLCNLYELS